MRFTSVVVACLLPMLAQAVPTQTRHQGRLLDVDGVAINGTVSLTFALHVDASTASTVWTELHAGTELADGVYSVTLGESVALDSSVFTGSTLWLSVTGPSGELGPRTAVVSVPYAVQAGSVSGPVTATSLTMPSRPAFFARAPAASSENAGWTETVAYTDSGAGTFDIGGNFAAGVFTAPVDGLYFFAASARLDSANTDHMRLVIGTNGSTDSNSNPHTIIGSPSANYQSLVISGMKQLTAGQTASVKLYVHSDNSWTRQTEGSFSGYLVSEL
jgi:hypothetical protein